MLNKKRKKCIISFLIPILFLLSTIFLPLIQAEKNLDHIKGFDKGPSNLPVVPLKRAIIVDHDKDSDLDDYSYLACVPSSVFMNKGKLFSNPLLFYEEEYQWDEDLERSLNARDGLNYFMQDWMSYCGDQLDQMTLINIDENKINKKEWDSKDYKIIKSDNIYKIAEEIALQDWSYANNAVVAVIDEYKDFNEKTSGTIKGSIDIDKNIKTESFTVEQTNKLNPQFKDFNVPEGYLYLQARAWYSSFYFALPGVMNVTIPSGDKDLQIYCKYDGDWMQVEAVDAWNAKNGMDKDYGYSYVYNPGDWRIGITDVPTKAIGKYGSWNEIFQNIFKGVTYKVDIEMYPGEKIPFNVKPPFYCRDVTFEINYDNPNINLEFLLLGPGGEKVAEAENGIIKLNQLGECLNGENYEFVIYSKDNKKEEIDYEITYSWSQNKTRSESDSLTSATEGAVLASMLNSPLIYTSKKDLRKSTKDVLYKLGVKNIHLVNIGNHLSKEIFDELKEIADIKNNYKKHENIYKAIQDLSDSNDIVFSTIDPWTYWYVAEMKPAHETKSSLFIGPAAYIAAHHQTPVLIVDNHPELSSASVWHTEFWRNGAKGYKTPTVSEMYLTGSRVYDFLKKHDFDKKGMESIITVAGQFDIGASWDRVFVGKASSGRFTFSPVDTAYWISRNVFYPALIFENPGMEKTGIELINGSKSTRGILGNLKIIRESGPEQYNYPVLQSFMPVYIHRFNERASKYWGFTYQCADGITPAKDNTFEAIDDGVNKYSTGELGSFWPDLSETDTIPFYLNQCGFDNVFSTNFDIAMENLNKGVIMWIVGSHGNSPNGGELMFHDPDSPLRSKKEPNPWRGYEWLGGSTEEPDTMTMEMNGIIPAALGNPEWNGIFRTSIDYARAKKPLLDLTGRILGKIPIIKNIAPDWLIDTQDYYDGVVGSLILSTQGTKQINGIDIDNSLENLHSCAFITAACLPAYKYLHLAMVRHGSNFQIIDPWGTSWYSSFWEATIPRDIGLGDTVGEAYVKGMAHVGILYLGGAGGSCDEPQWWWDKAENVCYFGDPDLRLYNPDTKYSSNNHWDEGETKALSYDKDLNIKGHMPFGATSYPHQREPETILEKLLVYIILIVVLILIMIIAFVGNKKMRK